MPGRCEIAPAFYIMLVIKYLSYNAQAHRAPIDPVGHTQHINALW